MKSTRYATKQEGFSHRSFPSLGGKAKPGLLRLKFFGDFVSAAVRAIARMFALRSESFGGILLSTLLL